MQVGITSQQGSATKLKVGVHSGCLNINDRTMWRRAVTDRGTKPGGSQWRGCQRIRQNLTLTLITRRWTWAEDEGCNVTKTGSGCKTSMRCDKNVLKLRSSPNKKKKTELFFWASKAILISEFSMRGRLLNRRSHARRVTYSVTRVTKGGKKWGTQTGYLTLKYDGADLFQWTLKVLQPKKKIPCAHKAFSPYEIQKYAEPAPCVQKLQALRPKVCRTSPLFGCPRWQRWRKWRWFPWRSPQRKTGWPGPGQDAGTTQTQLWRNHSDTCQWYIHVLIVTVHKWKGPLNWTDPPPPNHTKLVGDMIKQKVRYEMVKRYECTLYAGPKDKDQASDEYWIFLIISANRRGLFFNISLARNIRPI